MRDSGVDSSAGLGREGWEELGTAGGAVGAVTGAGRITGVVCSGATGGGGGGAGDEAVVREGEPDARSVAVSRHAIT